MVNEVQSYAEDEIDGRYCRGIQENLFVLSLNLHSVMKDPEALNAAKELKTAKDPSISLWLRGIRIPQHVFHSDLVLNRQSFDTTS